MEAETFICNFGTIADAPGGVDRLRELILNLAVRGQLVPQDVAEEPGTHFIERVKRERLRRLETKQSRGGLDVTEGLTLEAPYAPPEGWTWTSLGAACINRDAERIPLKSSDRAARQGEYDYYGASGAIDKINDYLFDGEMLLIGEDGANLTLRSTPIAFMASGRFWVNNHAHVIDSLSSAALRYLAVYVNSIDLKPYLTGIAQPKLNQKRLNSIPVPIPPEAEQARIVAKVDELMHLCDDLEARQQARQQVTARLLASSLDALTTAATDDDIHTAWSRIHTNWEAVSDRPESIANIRKAILGLGVRGKLVTQEADDGSAADLLDFIAAERELRGLRTGMRREAESHFEIPPTWRWTTFGFVTDTRLGKMLDKAKNTGDFRPYLRNTNVQWFKFRLEDVAELRLEATEFREYELRAGDLLICEGGEPGRASVCGRSVEGLIFQKALHRARPLLGVEPWYLAFLLRSYSTNGLLEKHFTGATIKHLTGRSLAAVAVPLPPVDEQRRIVDRVWEMLSLCDALETELKSRANAHAEVAQTLAAHLPRVADPAISRTRSSETR